MFKTFFEYLLIGIFVLIFPSFSITLLILSGLENAVKNFFIHLDPAWLGMAKLLFGLIIIALVLGSFIFDIMTFKKRYNFIKTRFLS